MRTEDAQGPADRRQAGGRGYDRRRDILDIASARDMAPPRVSEASLWGRDVVPIREVLASRRRLEGKGPPLRSAKRRGPRLRLMWRSGWRSRWAARLSRPVGLGSWPNRLATCPWGAPSPSPRELWFWETACAVGEVQVGGMDAPAFVRRAGSSLVAASAGSGDDGDAHALAVR